MTASRNINRPRLTWRPEYVDFVRQHYADSRTEDIATALDVRPDQVYRLATRLGLKKSDEYLNGPSSGRLDGVTGTSSRFKKGHQTWNKGAKGLQLCPRTQFKPGQKPVNHKPIGSLRFTKEGYLQVKLTDTGYPPRDWVMYQRHVWEQVNGPVPEGYVVCFKGRKPITDPAAITPDVLELLTKAQVMRENSRHNYGPELNEVITLRAAISRQINKRAKEGAQP